MTDSILHDPESRWRHWRTRVDEALPTLVGRGEPAALWNSMRYSVDAGGKRVRPLLVLSTIEALGRDAEPAIAAACAIELVHTFSLIHDDLPALDDDDLRRGRPSNHKVFGEATAILAGDALHALAFRILSTELLAGYPALSCLRAVRCLADAAVHGLACGQVADLHAGGRPVSAESVQFIHDRKTGSLFRCAVELGAILGEASTQQAADLDAYATHLGLAFQIADDVIDVTGSRESLGKSPGKDARDGKATYVQLHGIAGARERLAEAGARATNALAEWGAEADGLRALVTRVVGQAAPRPQLAPSSPRIALARCAP